MLANKSSKKLHEDIKKINSVFKGENFMKIG